MSTFYIPASSACMAEKNINAVTPCDRLDCDGRLITIFIGCRIIKERELKAKLKKEKEEVKS